MQGEVHCTSLSFFLFLFYFLFIFICVFFFYFPFFLSVKMEIIHSSEMFINIYQTTQCNNLKDQSMNCIKICQSLETSEEHLQGKILEVCQYWCYRFFWRLWELHPFCHKTWGTLVTHWSSTYHILPENWAKQMLKGRCSKSGMWCIHQIESMTRAVELAAMLELKDGKRGMH